MLHVQAHRGARGGKPENTLPAFELALDLGVDSIETDLRLTRDQAVVVFHDEAVTARLCRPLVGKELPRGPFARLDHFTLADLRAFSADASLSACPRQAIPPTPLAELFLAERNLPPFTIPTLEDLLRFLDAYASETGRQAGKSPTQQEKARRLRLDLELKGDPWEMVGHLPGELERRVAALIQEAGWVERVCLRSFDHRRMKTIRAIEPRLRTGILLAGTRPIDPVQLVRAAGAQELYPDYRQVDGSLVREMRAADVPLIPWTVNDAEAWERLADWGIDGITTDYPGELLLWARDRIH